MNRLDRVMRGALQSASLIALLLVGGLVLNGLLFGYAVFRMANTDVRSGIGEYAATLSACKTGYALSLEQEELLKQQNRFLMLLDQNGKVIWAYQKPQELPDAYSISDVAGFTRWYLMDYPVHVYAVKDGLLVLGMPKGTTWKYTVETPLPTLLFWPVWAAAALLCNFLFILLVSVGVTKHGYKKRDAARTEWIAAVSHDVRTPLSTVLGYAASLEADPLLPEAARGQAAQICAKGEELRSLIENLNLTNRLSHSMEPLQAEWLSPASVVREAVVSFLNNDTLSAYSIETEISPSAAGAQLYGDPALLFRMLKNLIGNGIRHNPKGCGIAVRLDASRRTLTLSVSDEGVGYSEKQLQALAAKQLPPTSGHGLGLTIVKQIVFAHHGRIQFRNADGGGSVCRITFKGSRRVRFHAKQNTGDTPSNMEMP